MENEQNNKEFESLTKHIRFKSLPFDEKRMSDRLTDRIKRPVIISYAGKGNSAWKYLSIAASIALLLVSSLLATIHTCNKKYHQGQFIIKILDGLCKFPAIKFICCLYKFVIFFWCMTFSIAVPALISGLLS